MHMSINKCKFWEMHLLPRSLQQRCYELMCENSKPLELQNRKNLLERWTHQRAKLPKQRRVNSIWITRFLYLFCLSSCVVTFMLSVAENILVSVAIVVERRLRRPSNGYILSLALTDICISLRLIPLEMIYVWSYLEWPQRNKCF